MAAEQIRLVAEALLTLTACFVSPLTCECRHSYVLTRASSRKMSELAPSGGEGQPDSGERCDTAPANH